MISEASRSLHEATRQRAFIESVQVLIHQTWNVMGRMGRAIDYSDSSWESNEVFFLFQIRFI